MGATLADLLERQDNLLANSKTGSYTESQRVEAINDSILEVARYYDWVFLNVYDGIVTDSDGTASLPADFMKAGNLYEEANGSNEEIQTEYFYVPQMDSLYARAYHWTILNIDTLGVFTEKIKIYPEEVKTLKFWYKKRPYTDVLSESTDVSGFPSDFDLPIAMLACANMYEQKHKEGGSHNVLRYGSGGNMNRPEPSSGYGRLNQLIKQYQQRSKINVGHLKSRIYHSNFYNR